MAAQPLKIPKWGLVLMLVSSVIGALLLSVQLYVIRGS
jgi:hypothetical protein